ncbi:MAG: hypothetical protein Q3968_03330 [Clostridiaceae bacterium]|nr:hypothetical protein [Clostridiaceae bacterium]
MKKSTKLLSVFLAVIMILSSLTVAAFAAKTSYQTAANLTSLAAYSPYGTVTRLSTEERMSITMDWLDRILATKQDLNMGEVFNKVGISIYINLTSVDEICKTLDSFRAALTSGTWGLAATFVNLGVLEDLEFSSWQSGMSRSGTAQLTIIYELLELLSKNTTAVNTILSSGIDLGLANSALASLDMNKINGIVTDLPSFAKTMIYQKLFNRPDDTAALRTKYATAGTNANLVTYLNDFVKGIFTKKMKWTSYREDAAGYDLGYTDALPTSNTTSRYFTKTGDTITQRDYDYEKGAWVVTVEYTKDQEFEGSDEYVYRAPEGYDGDQTLKWYTAGDEGYFLPKVRAAINNGDITIDLNGSDSVLGLVYKFAPYLFDEMAVVVLNGSVKKLVAELFGVEFTKIGDRDPDTNKIYDGNGKEVTGLPNNAFFTSDQQPYVWEYTDYIVIDDVPYYRYQEEYFKGNLPLHLSSYYSMFNWNYKITGDWANEFIPGQEGCTRTRILPALNDFIGKAIELVILPTWESKGTTYTRDDIFAWETGDLDKLAGNILAVARKVFPIAPEEIIDDYYMEAQFYDAMMNGTQSEAINGLVCECVKLLMPQIVWPDNVIHQDMLSIAAIVVRELLTDLMPSYDFDALIYSDYNNRALIEGKDKTYWTNVVLTMGMDIGMYYLRNLADLGEDTANSYFKVMNNLGALNSADAETQTYPADYDVSQWTEKVDWVIDWALSTTEWGWRMSKLVNVSFDITKPEDPWAKLNTILLKILPLNQLLNDSGITTAEAPSNTFLEKILRGKLVNAISDLDFATFVSAFDVPSGYFTNTKILDQAVKLIVYILNGATNTVLGQDIFRSGTYTSLDALLNHSNLKTDVKNLVGKLTTLYNNGLLDVAMPFVTMFLGWKSDPQVYADPQLIFENSQGYNYYYTSGTETLKISNGSAGMLLKHRTSLAVDGTNLANPDNAYAIKVLSVTSNDGTIGTSTSLPKTLQPWEETTLTLTNSSNTARTVQVTIAYTFTGKDGTAIGGTQYATNTTYVTSQKSSQSTVAQSSNYKTTGGFLGATTYTNWYRGAYESIIFTNVKDGITGFGVPFKNEGSYTSWVIDASQNTAPTSPLTMFTANVTAGGYVHGADENTSYKDADHGWMANKDNDGGSCEMSVFPLKVNGDLVSGTAYSGGKLNITIGNKKNGTKSRSTITGLQLPTFYYYNTSVLDDVWAKVQKVTKASLTGDYTAAYNAFLTKLDAAAQAMVAPKLTSNFSTVFNESTLETLAEELDAAYQALIDGGYYASADADTNLTKLQTALDAAEDRANGEDYDFADHALFEYFQYEKQRTETRNMIKALTAPVAPEKYIDGEALSQADIEAIIAAQSNANIKTGINNTFWDPSNEALDEYARTMANWKPADYSELQVDNQIVLLGYYRTFMMNLTRNLTASYQKQFLNREISYAQAQNYVAADYTTATWAAYTDALANAQAVAADSSKLPSEIFDAKYQLMIAQHDLLKKSRSMLEDGDNYLDGELTGLIANAEVILNNINYYDVVDGMTQAEALGQLVKALGVRYNLNGNDAILYDHSAYTFVDYDRVDSTKNRLRVDEAADKLQAAIDNFVCNVVIESTDANVISNVETGIKLIKGVLPGAIKSLTDLLNYVEGSVAEAVLNPAASAAGLFGTGATVTLNIPAIGDLAIYKVLIFGDVNGDGAIDAFDIFTVDKASGATPIVVLEDVYRDAADISADGEIGLADYNAVRDDVAGTATINQAA